MINKCLQLYTKIYIRLVFVNRLSVKYVCVNLFAIYYSKQSNNIFAALRNPRKMPVFSSNNAIKTQR